MQLCKNHYGNVCSLNVLTQPNTQLIKDIIRFRSGTRYGALNQLIVIQHHARVVLVLDQLKDVLDTFYLSRDTVLVVDVHHLNILSYLWEEDSTLLLLSHRHCAFLVLVEVIA